MKLPDESARAEIAKLSGQLARQAGFETTEADSFVYDDHTFRTGTYDHWQLMKRACYSKFTQHDPAKQALLGTGQRPLTHRMRKDSRTIPGVIMADIWLQVRKKLNTD